MTKKYTNLTAPLGNKINAQGSFHPDKDKAKAIEDAFLDPAYSQPTKVNGRAIEDSFLEPGPDYRKIQKDKAKIIEDVFLEPENTSTRNLIKTLVSHNFSVVIPTHNGAENLAKSMPALMEGVAAYRRGKVEIILLDNNSVDNSGALVKRKWPHVNVIRYSKTLGMPELLNQGIKQAKNKAVFVMEDDVKVALDFALPLLEAISDDDIFAAVPGIHEEKRGGMISSINLLKFIDGTLSLHMISDGNFREPVYIPGLSSTAFMCRKDTFNDLGGFDEIFSPKYFEDLDLGYRAWKRGQRVVYCRRSNVYHWNSDSFETKLETPEWQWLKIRNYLLFMKKNITGSAIYSSHWMKVAKKIAMIYLGIDKDQLYLKGWKRACKLSGAIAKTRTKEKREAYFTDKELIRLFSSHPDNRIGIG